MGGLLEQLTPAPPRIPRQLSGSLEQPSTLPFGCQQSPLSLNGLLMLLLKVGECDLVPVAKLLVRRGLADDEDCDQPLDAMQQLTLAAVRSLAAKRRSFPNQRYKALCAQVDGFTLHAATRVAKHRRRELEVLCKYTTRPAVSTDRVRWREDGLVEWSLSRGAIHESSASNDSLEL